MLKIELNHTAVSMIRLIKLRVSFRFFERQLVGYRWQGLYTQKIRTNRTNQNGQQLPAFFRLCRKQHIVVQKNFWSNTAQANHDRWPQDSHRSRFTQLNPKERRSSERSVARQLKSRPRNWHTRCSVMIWTPEDHGWPMRPPIRAVSMTTRWSCTVCL